MPILEQEGNNREVIHLDYTIQDPAERAALVQKIVDNASPEQLTPKYLQILSNYIIFSMDKEQRKQKTILTDNHMVTVDKRETSFEGLITKFENGQDAIYNMITNDKNIIFAPKIEITQQDLDTIPELRELRQAIDQVEEMKSKASGKRRSLLMKQLIEMRKDQYVIKNSYQRPIFFMNATKQSHRVKFWDKITILDNGELKIEGNFSFLRPQDVSVLLKNYSRVKEDAYGQFNSDSYYMILDLQNLIQRTLPQEYPLLYDLMIYKIDGKTNEEIQRLLEQKHGIKHSVEYISSLWCNKIPKLLADKAKKEWLVWHYTQEEKGKWKRCSRCGEVKLAHNEFFSKNKSSKDGFYSICKCCRNKKK